MSEEFVSAFPLYSRIRNKTQGNSLWSWKIPSTARSRSSTCHCIGGQMEGQRRWHYRLRVKPTDAHLVPSRNSLANQSSGLDARRWRVKRRLRRRGRRHRCWKWRESKHTPCFFSEAQPKWRLCFWHSQNTQRASAWLKNVANSSSYNIKMVQFMTLLKKKKAKHIKLLRVLFIFIDSYRRMFMRVPILLEENY